MAAQQGTVNLVGDAAFLVVSVPVSALRGVDDDGDGRLSRAELAAHDTAIRAQLLEGVRLVGPQGAWPLSLVMVDLSPPDDAPAAPASQLVVLGRFGAQVQDARPAAPGVAAAEAPVALQLHFTLFGAAPHERQQDFTITRGQERQLLRLAPGRASGELLPAGWAAFAGRLREGASRLLQAPLALAAPAAAALLAAACWWAARRRRAAGYDRRTR